MKQTNLIKHCLFVLFLLSGINSKSFSQVAITTDGSAPQASAMLEVKSTTKGFLGPRMTQAQRDAIASPAAGLIIYQTDGTTGYYVYNGATWSALAGAGTSKWNLNGSHIYNTNAGNVGIGISTPQTPLHVYNNTADELIRLEGNNPYVGFRLVGGTLRSYMQGYINDLLVGTASGNATGRIMFYNNNVPNMTILPSGFVGIGTTTPNSGLEVRGTGFGAQQRITDPTSGNSLVFQAGSGTGMRVTGYNYGNGTGQPIYLSYDGGSTYINHNGGVAQVGSFASPSKLTVYAQDYGIEHSDGTRRISTYINSAGGWLGTVSNHNMNFFTNDGAAAMTITTGGGVGINNTNPTPGYYLDVAGYIKSQLNQSTGFVAHTTGGTNAWARYYVRTNSQSWLMGSSQNFIGNQFYIADETFNQSRFTIQPNNGLIWLSTATGVGINTTNTAGYMLAVNGKIHSTELVIETGWADYVFDKNYKLRPLSEVEKFIQQNKHLPNIPSAAEIENNGLNVGDIQKKMMEKIEELTLYVIEQEKKIKNLESTVLELTKKN